MTFNELFGDRFINIRAFARANGIPPTTLYSIVSGKCRPENIGVGTFIKIATGLGMTADELCKLVLVNED